VRLRERGYEDGDEEKSKRGVPARVTTNIRPAPALLSATHFVLSGLAGR